MPAPPAATIFSISRREMLRENLAIAFLLLLMRESVPIQLDPKSVCSPHSLPWPIAFLLSRCAPQSQRGQAD